MPTPNTVLNLGSGGDTVRDIDMGSGVKAQVVFTIDPALVVTVRATYTAAQTDQIVVANSAGTRLAVTQAYAVTSAATTVDVSFRVGFGATTPTTTGVVLSHPGLASGLNCWRGDGAGIIGVSADGVPLRITISVPTSGTFDVIVSYMPLLTAGM